MQQNDNSFLLSVDDGDVEVCLSREYNDAHIVQARKGSDFQGRIPLSLLTSGLDKGIKRAS